VVADILRLFAFLTLPNKLVVIKGGVSLFFPPHDQREEMGRSFFQTRDGLFFPSRDFAVFLSSAGRFYPLLSSLSTSPSTLCPPARHTEVNVFFWHSITTILFFPPPCVRYLLFIEVPVLLLPSVSIGMSGLLFFLSWRT